MKWICLLILFPFTAVALNWESDWHHLEPQLNESFELVNSINDNNPICEDEPKLATYISQEPSNEKWRKYYKLPTLLTDKLYKTQDVCEKAKAQNKEQGVDRKYAIIANKTHFCDTGHKACLSAQKSLSDPCNKFIQDNFQTFHTRTYSGGMATPGAKEIAKEYGGMGPSLLVIRLSDCTLLPTLNAKNELQKGVAESKLRQENYYYTPITLNDAVDKTGEKAFRSKDESVRFHSMKESLTTNIPELAKLKDAPVDCYQDGQRTLPGITDDEEVQYGKIKMKGLLVTRKLADEQFFKIYGRSPYEKPIQKK